MNLARTEARHVSEFLSSQNSHSEPLNIHFELSNINPVPIGKEKRKRREGGRESRTEVELENFQFSRHGFLPCLIPQGDYLHSASSCLSIFTFLVSFWPCYTVHMYTIEYIYTYAFCYIPHLRKGYVIFFLTLCDLNNTIYAKFTHLPWLFVITLFRAEQYSIALTFHVQHLYHMPLIFLSIFDQFQPVPVTRALQYNLRLGLKHLQFLLLSLALSGLLNYLLNISN